MSHQSKSILVTGGAGFVGSHLCEALLSQGHEVVSLDNFYTGDIKNIKHLESNPRFKSIFFDICDPLDLFEDTPFDQIYNLACPASPPHYQADPIYTTKISVLGMLNVLHLASRINARVLQASTSEVYGDPEVHPQVETYRGCVNPIGIRSCYDEGKRVAESLCYDYNRTRGVEVRVARIFNTYGPRMDPEDGRVVSNFIVQALKGEDITIYGDGSQTRSFCYVSDLVDGLIKLMNSDVTTPVNLGNPDEFTIKELATQVLAKIESNSNTVFNPLPSDDPTRRKPDISKAMSNLSWSPTIKLEDGLTTTIDYFRSVI